MRLRALHYDEIEEQVQRILLDVIFRPLSDALKSVSDWHESSSMVTRAAREVLSNAPSDELARALRGGSIQYAEGIFSGQFSSAASRALRVIGAKFDKRAGVYRLSPGKVPAWVLAEAENFRTLAREAHVLLVKALDDATVRLDKLVDEAALNAESVVGTAVSGWRAAAKKLEVSPDLSLGAKERLKAGYKESIKLPIKKFARQEIVKLREVVEGNAEQGYRFDALIDKIKLRYDVTQSKAKFLARQETGLFMSKFREERFKDAGVTRYRWSTSNDERVRDSHADLNGTVQFYDSPPIVDRTSGKRANPGQDWQCRCIDIPILDDVAVAV